MRFTSFFIFAVCLQVSAASFGQRVTISGQDLPLEKVFSMIKRQTGYVFFYDYSIFRNAKSVTIDIRDAEINDAMKLCLEGQRLSYNITNKTIVVVKEEPKALAAVPPSASDKNVPVSGTVYNENGQPLGGANVTVKSTGRGTITNAKGEFSLSVPANTTLIVSFIGYAPQQVSVKDASGMTIYLKTAKDELDKVVVQAYGTTTQRLATGNIATVTSAQIERQPVMNVMEALQGQVPGVVVQQTSGFASAPFKVEIRGRNGINPNLAQEPLYIVDGVPLTVLETGSDNYATGSRGFAQNGFNGPAGGQSPFFSINPQDVEALTVLKDADATAIYGSRGANGVIIINTKHGKVGKTKLDINAYHGIAKTTGHFDLMNLQQYLAMRREAFQNDAIYGITPDAGNAYDLTVWDTTRYTDWQKLQLGGVALTTDVETGISGGDKQMTFRISGAYHTQKSPLTYSGKDQRGSLQFNLTHKSIDQRLTMSLTTMYSYAQANLIDYNYGILQAPNAPGIFDEFGHLNYSGWLPVNYNYPYASILQPYKGRTTFLNSQLSFQYQIVKGLTFSTNLGYSNHHLDQEQIVPIASLDPTTYPTGSSNFGTNSGSSTIIEPQLEYKTNVGKGKFSAMVGGSTQIVSQYGNTIIGTGYVNDALLHSISNAPVKNAADLQAAYKYAATFARINYNWDEKYILNISARRDGSSRFGPGKRFGNFGAVGAAWIFTQENWFQHNLKFLSFGKIRASYGITGSDQVGQYRYLTQWSGTTIHPYQPEAPSYTPTLLANPDFHWQSNKKLEAALALGFLNDKINIEGSFYRNRCDDQLVEAPLPSQTGFGNITANSPANVQNSGWEVILRLKLMNTKDIDWSVNINGGRNYNKLLSYPNLSLANPFYINHFVVGRPLNIQSVLHYLGVDPQTGQYSFQDQNKDGAINALTPASGGDMYYKEINILLDGGVGSDFRYKNWQLNLFLTYRQNPFVVSGVYNGIAGQIFNQSTKVLDRWQKAGDVKKYARYTTQGLESDGNYSASDGIYSSGSYIRLRNVAVSYDFPSSWIKRAGIQGCRFYFRGENLFVLTKYDGLDPDVPGLAAFPPAKTFTGGIQLTF